MEEVDGVYIIDRESGIVLAEDSLIKEDPMLVGGLIHAISTFLASTLGSRKMLRAIDSGDVKLILEHGTRYTAVAVAKRDDPIIRKKLNLLIEAITDKISLRPDIINTTGNPELKAIIARIFEIRKMVALESV
ncbi:MAG: hypothetical protein QXL15_03120 [Candidatus Korarchaeota archaeon]